MLFGINEMRPHVILDDLGHQTGHRAPRPGDEMHHLFAARLAVERALNRLDLAPDPAHARQQLVFFANRMSHTALSHTSPAPVGVHKVAGVAGLYLKIGETGAGSYFYRYRLGDRRREIGLGSRDKVSLADACRAAKAWAVLRADG